MQLILHQRKKQKRDIQEIWDGIKWSDVYALGIPKRERK
jgi:hypothetical protein